MVKKRVKLITIKQIFELAVKKGIEADFRPKKDINDILKRKSEAYEKLNREEREEYDKEKLTNPYMDSGILNIASDKPIRKILAGIDIGEAELLLADKIGGIDLVLGHHPIGKYLSNLDSVMHLQADVLNQYGVPINIAESVLKERISEVSRGILPINHNRPVDIARLLSINLMNVHTPCDNLAANFLNKKVKESKIKYVSDLLKLLKSIPEYREAIKIGAGPRLFAGSEENRAGKIALTEITGGTEGSPKIYEKMSQAGIGTIVGMHMSEEHKKEAEKAHINVVIAGHISSDSLGMNLFLDELERKGIEVIPCSGLIRVKRF
jgi:putative NIF3 family GTP cyclohydrolase 1 type 2